MRVAGRQIHGCERGVGYWIARIEVQGAPGGRKRTGDFRIGIGGSPSGVAGSFASVSVV